MKKGLAVLLLLITTFFWGIGFTLVKDAVARVDVFVFLAQRFLVAFLVLLLPCLLLRRPLNRSALRDGLILGSCLFGAFALQTIALNYTSATNVGFLTGLNVVMVPILGTLFLRQRVGLGVGLGALLAATGLFLLCSNGSAWHANPGDLLGVGCALCVALHLLLTSQFARKSGSDVLWITTLQVGTVFLLSYLVALWRGQPVLSHHPGTASAVLICALGATVFAFLVQTAMQRVLSPSHTALIFCMEPVFAALYAWWAAGERLGPFGVVGALLIFAGMLASELIPARGEDGEFSLAPEPGME